MPLSWGRRYCVYKYQGFLFYIVTLVLSNVHAFRIGSFLSLPIYLYRASLDTAGTDYIQSSRWNIDTDQVIVLYQGDRSPLGSLRGYMSDRRASGRSGETTVGDQCDGLYQLRIGGDRFCRIKHFWHSTSFRSFITDKYRFSRMDFLL